MRNLSIVSWILATVLLIHAPASAGTTGKITGTVTDAEGRPLPGTTVVVEDSELGAHADSQGIYFILGVPPGRRTVTASMIGYEAVRIIEVRVKADQTTNANFELREQAIELERFVVQAERWRAPAVDPDRTSTTYMVFLEDLEQNPIVKTAGELVSLQPGVDLFGTFAVRGSDISFGNNPLVSRPGNRFT
ncbi:MAG: carboxypeptidase-like regulatory domain-containing protein [Candidatus Latescibacteria bacterium]|jgi:hypothetical protein|nr:carboxypeptidase-like regulatory domain-containing protein [Candidatus Latescibacterota bacterium]